MYSSTLTFYNSNWTARDERESVFGISKTLGKKSSIIGQKVASQHKTIPSIKSVFSAFMEIKLFSNHVPVIKKKL